jgi:outer membrane murein-binding lipoprotein Lpp
MQTPRVRKGLQEMNPITITAIAAVASVILAIFGAGWLNQQGMNKRIDDLKSYLDARFQAVEAEFKSVRAEIATVRTEVVHGSQRLDRIERQLEAIFKPVLPKSGD